MSRFSAHAQAAAPPVPIQVCFQGGGAKIAALLAAAAVLQELEQAEKKIKITRITGTSAGAIVAAFLAADCNLADVIKDLAGKGGGDLEAAYTRPGTPTMAWSALRSKPFWDSAPLAAWLNRRLKESRLKDGRGQRRTPRFLSDLPVPVTVVCANLDSGRAEERTGKAEIISSLLESAGIPFFFRTWESGGNNLVVDGGLCGNLPVDELLKNIGDGRIVAFSFDEERPARPRNLLGFTTSLIDQAISHSVEIARARVGTDSVCSLRPDPPIDTFAFGDARKFLQQDARLNALKDQVRQWFTAFLTPSSRSDIKHDFWHETNANLHELMRGVGRVFAAQQAVQKIRYHEIRMIVTANCLARPGEEGFQQQDLVSYEYFFEPVGGPLFAQRLTLTAHSGSYFSGKYAVELFADKSQTVEVAVIPTLSEARPTDRELIGYFLPPLQPGTGVYHLRLADLGTDTMRGLVGPDRIDHIELGLSLADGSSIPVFRLALHVPKSFPAVVIKAADNIPLEVCRKMASAETARHFAGPPLDFRTEAWEIGPFPLPGKPLRVYLG